MKPWTWEEIAKLKGRAAKSFMRAYGDRGVVALLAAGHEPGMWKAECPYAGVERCVLRWQHLGTCPMDGWSEWRKGDSQLPCSQMAMEVYTRMVAKLGLMPKEKK